MLNEKLEVMQYALENELSLKEVEEKFHIKLEDIDMRLFNDIVRLIDVRKRRKKEIENEKLLEIARTMLEEDLTYIETVERFDIKSVYFLKKYLYNDLPEIDFSLYSKIVEEYTDFDKRKVKAGIATNTNAKRVKNIITGEIYFSQMEAARKTGYNFATINKHCNNKVKKPMFEYVK